MKIKVDFNGGLEDLFDKKKNIDVLIEKNEVNVEDLIMTLRKDHLKSKPELFVDQGQLKPGILCLINDMDWEIEDKEKTILKDND